MGDLWGQEGKSAAESMHFGGTSVWVWEFIPGCSMGWRGVVEGGGSLRESKEQEVSVCGGREQEK